jgi:adenylate cyclase
MPARWWGDKDKQAVSADFADVLTQEVLRTELIRIKALIATTSLLAVLLSTIFTLEPEVLNHIWRGRLRPAYLYAVLIPFILFELWVHAAVNRHLKLHRDLPVLRRYLGALIETSTPTVALALHIENMGPVQGLGFVAPLAYFVFIILSTLRLDFWLSTFTGFVAAIELLCMAIFYHPTVNPDPQPEIFYHAVRSLIILICGMLAGTVGVQLRRQFAGTIRAATARDRITDLFGQHVSPQVVERLMIEGADTAGDIRRVAVMFVDFRSFGGNPRSPWRHRQQIPR